MTVDNYSVDIFGNATNNHTNNNNSNSWSLGDGSHTISLLPFHNLIFLSFNLILVPFIIGGNFLVLLSIATFHRLQTVSNIFVASLAVADLLVGLFVIPFYSVYYLRLPGLAENKYMCLFKYAFIIESCGSSIFNLSAIAFERFMAVCYPFRYATLITHQKAKMIVAILWIYVTSLSIAPLVGLNTWQPNAGCDFYQVLPRSYTVVASFVTVSVGILFTAIFYTLTYMEIRKMKPPPVVQERQENVKKKNVKATYVMAVVSVTFLVFWLPYLLVGPLKYSSSLNKDLIEVIKNYTLSLAISNSMLNPFIYGCLRKEFMIAFQRYLAIPCFNKRQRTIEPSTCLQTVKSTSSSQTNQN